MCIKCLQNIFIWCILSFVHFCFYPKMGSWLASMWTIFVECLHFKIVQWLITTYFINKIKTLLYYILFMHIEHNYFSSTHISIYKHSCFFKCNGNWFCDDFVLHLKAHVIKTNYIFFFSFVVNKRYKFKKTDNKQFYTQICHNIVNKNSISGNN